MIDQRIMSAGDEQQPLIRRTKLRKREAERLLIQADVTKVENIARMFATVRDGKGGLQPRQFAVFSAPRVGS